MKYIVDRKTWFRGQTSRFSRLLNHDGMRCCIGHVGKQCEIPDSNLLGESTIIWDGRKGHDKFPVWMLESHKVSHSDACQDKCEGKTYDIFEAYRVNDDSTITDEVREEKLKAIFAKNGDEIEFIN